MIDAIVATLTAADHPFSSNFERAFRTWENQEGFPLVHVAYNSSIRSFVLTQKRFFEKKNENSDNQSWYIPINFATELNPNFENFDVTHMMVDGDSQTVIPVEGLDESKWFIFNIQQVGYFRTNYDTPNWIAITKFLHTDQFEKIHAVNRMHLVDDAFVLAHGGYLDYEVPYNLITYLAQELNFFPWEIFERNLELLLDVYGMEDRTLQVGK